MDRTGAAIGSCLLALALVAGAPARAGQPEAGTTDTDYTEFSLDQLMAMDVVYGASSYDQKITDAPAAVTVITADEIRAHGYRTLADVLASVRGFSVTYDRSYRYVGVRGFGRPGDYDTRVLILHDGHPANDIIYGTAAVGADLAQDLTPVKRIEIIRGPGSALYGAGAFFAVVNLVTYDGSELGDAEVAVEYGSRNRAGGHVMWGGDLGRGASLLLGGGGFDDDGDDLYWPEFDDPATNDGWFPDGDRERAGHLYAKYTRGTLRATAIWARRDKNIPTAEYGMIFGDTAAKVIDERLALDLSGSRRLSGGSTIRARLSYDDYSCRGDYPFDAAEPGQPLERLVQHDEAHGRWWSGELQWTGQWARHRLVSGADFRQSATAAQTSIIVDPYESLQDIDNSLGNAGLYLQDELTLGRRSSVYLGLRYDNYRSFGGNLTPRCGLVTHLDDRTAAKLLYGEAFRAPYAYELYYADGLTQKASPGLDPEQIRTWELVVERELGDRVRVGLSLFDNAITGLIDPVLDPVDTMLVFRNVGDASTSGAELDLDARLLTGLRGRASYSYQRTEDDATGVTLTNAPEQMFKLNLTTPRQGVALAGALEVQNVSRRRTLTGGYVPSYVVFNVDVTWWTPLSGLQADLAVDNAFDADYSDPGAAHQVQDALIREGRLLLARLTWRW